jgi:hypothetical protein
MEVSAMILAMGKKKRYSSFPLHPPCFPGNSEIAKVQNQ